MQLFMWYWWLWRAAIHGVARVRHDCATDLIWWPHRLVYKAPWSIVRKEFLVKFRSVSQSVQSLCHVWLFVTPWIASCQASLSITNSRSSLKLMSMELVMPSSHLILSSCTQSIPAWVFSNESILHIRWPKYWSYSFSISPSNEHTGLISFRMDWLDLLAVQGTLKSLLQHHISKASILQCSVFFTVQLTHPYMTTGNLT